AQPTAEQLEHRPIAGQAGGCGAVERTPQEQQIFVGMLPGGRVETVNREMRKDFAERAPDRWAAHIGANRAREAMERPRRGVELRRETAVENFAAARLGFGGERRRAPTDLRPQRRERFLCGAVVEHRADLVHEIITAGAIAVPIAPQMFAGSEYFFDDE